MKIVIRTVFFHILCIIIFALFYYYFRDHFKRYNEEEFTVLDYLFSSINIQSGVGLNNIYPITSYGKVIIIIQELIMIMTHVFTIYIFTI